MATFPADNFEDAVELSITASNQLHEILNGDAETEVAVQDGSKIPSVRKAMVDSLYLISPIAWEEGGYESKYNQLRSFEEDSGTITWWYAPRSSISSPTLMSVTPHNDNNWSLWSVNVNTTRELVKRAAAEAGFNLVDGSAESGAELLVYPDVLWYQADGKYYQPPSYPQTVSAGFNPSSALDWVSKIEVTLRDTVDDIVNDAVVEIATDIAAAAVVVALDDLDLTKPYVTSSTPAMIELGTNSVETFDTRRTTSSDVYIAEDVKDGTFLLERTLFGSTKMEPFHPSEFPVDFTPAAPQLLVGPTYTTDPTYTERVYQGCPSATKTNNVLWCGFRGDIQLYTEGEDTDVAEHTGNFVTLCRSFDGGATWSEYGYVRYVGDTTKCCHEPVLWTAPDGKLWVFVTVSGDNTDTDGVYGSYVYVCKNPDSTASFLQWETPVKIFQCGFANFPPVNVDGKWLMCNYLLQDVLENDPVYPRYVGKHVYELDIVNKKAFHIAKLPDSIDTASFSEISLAQNHDGTVRAIWRTANSSASLETSISNDGGVTWGAAAKYTSSVGPNASTRAVIKTSPSGRTVLVYNNEAINRRYLTVALSEDGGATYPYKMDVERPQPLSSSYPDIVFGDNGDFYIFHDKARSTAGFRKIICTKMFEIDIVNGIFNVTNTYVSDKGYVVL